MKFLLLLSLAAASTATAATDTALLRCRGISDDAARLACYDALVPAPLQLPAASDTATSSAVPTARVPVTPEHATRQTPASVVAPAAPVVSQAPAEFGLERQSAAAQLEKIESRISGTFRGWDAKSKITLDNGQVWQIADGSRGVYTLESPAVRVERGMFGAFFLKIEGANRTPKVKRLK